MPVGLGIEMKVTYIEPEQGVILNRVSIELNM